MIYQILLLLNILFSVMAQLFLKFGMKKIGLVELNVNLFQGFKRMVASPYLWFALICFGLSFVLYAIVLSKVELSRAYPVALLGAVVLIFMISVIFFNETFNSAKILGLIFAVIGLVFLFR